MSAEDDDGGLLGLVWNAGTQAGGIVAILGGVLNAPIFSAIWATLVGSAGKLLAIVGPIAFTVAPRLSWLPKKPLLGAFFVLLAVALWKRTDAVIDTFQQNLRRNQ